MPKSHLRTCLLAPVLGLGLLACSADSGSSDPFGPSSTPVAFESYCTEYAQMTCDVAQTCGCLQGVPIQYCLSYQGSDCHDSVELPVQSGRRRYDPSAAGQCLAETQAIIEDCSLDGVEWPTACDQMLVGQVPAGGSCDSDGDCVGTLECDGDHCLALPTDGAACHPQYGCATGNFCGQDGLCHGYRGAGAPCPEGSVACASELYCRPSSQTCEPYEGPGASCAGATGACRSGLYCSSGSQSCQPYPSNGQSCADSGGSCADDSYCGDDSLCHAELPAGASCTSGAQCLSGSCTSTQCEAVTSDVC